MTTSSQPPIITRLTWSTLLFPLALVLFEFATYISNDMILPGMPAVVHEFGADPTLIPSAMTLSLLGGASLQWLLGPLSDRVGRRPVMLSGVLFFTFACIGILWVETFAAFLFFRFLQGIGLCFIGAVGYASIQESFSETLAVRVMAMMANVALIAPLIGPVAGAGVLLVADWRWIFIVVAIVSVLSLLGLWFKMPESSPKVTSPLRINTLWQEYKLVFQNRRFRLGGLALGLNCLPLLGWIALAPVVLMQKAGLSTFDYGLWQIPVFAGLIIGNIILAKFVVTIPIYRLIRLGTWPMMIGLIGALYLVIAPQNWLCLIACMGFAALGMGMINAALYRLTLFSSDQNKGTVAASLGMFNMVVFASGIELLKWAYAHWGNASFVLICFVSGLIALWARREFLRGAHGEVAA
ncbi:MFS transporter [Chitinibacter bivalviorum]|uniref:Multidrug transporter MdfA n=1 Tax=Chitinibacter bivalviorum TaxID=2739434 RepID=A0A7H9BGI0_9NEIS|nr:MFS transporter [Chitinibacter bivalviorum]QLG87695.1 MFS transporter [Chitinibacter bivalviorum]